MGVLWIGEVGRLLVVVEVIGSRRSGRCNTIRSLCEYMGGEMCPGGRGGDEKCRRAENILCVNQLIHYERMNADTDERSISTFLSFSDRFSQSSTIFVVWKSHCLRAKYSNGPMALRSFPLRRTSLQLIIYPF